MIDEKVLNFTEFDKLVKPARSGASLIDFAQLIIDSDICEDLEKVQAVLDAAVDEVTAGEKAPYDPVDTGEDDYDPHPVDSAPSEPEEQAQIRVMLAS